MLPANLSIHNYSGAILAASVHRQKHEPEIERFVNDHLNDLEQIPTAFLSVSLSEAGAEDTTAPSERREKATGDAQEMIQTFLSDTGWHPTRTQAVAGALMYSKYNFLLRLVMKRIARQAGADTDSSKDYEYTDWLSLDMLVDELTALIMSPEKSVRTAGSDR
jgi:menaquinone-dependent protoporphyrinogen oxidase